MLFPKETRNNSIIYCTASQAIPPQFVRFPQEFAGTHLYTWVERRNVRLKRLDREHKTMSSARQGSNPDCLICK